MLKYISYICKMNNRNTMNRLLRKIFTIAILANTICLTAQNTHLFTTDNGLSNSLINEIIQDKYGYIWIATEDGLNRFDGIKFKRYGTEDLSHSYVHSIYEDKDGTLWIGTLTGLLTYNRENDTFNQIPIIYNGDTIEAHISDIVEDSKGNIWVASTGRGLLICQDNIAHNCQEYVGIRDIEFTSSVIIENAIDKGGTSYDNLWIVAHKNGVYCINLKTKEVSLVPISNNKPLAENAFVQSINGEIYLSADGSNTMIYNREKHLFEPTNINSGGFFCSALSARDEEILIGTDGNGLFSYDSKKQEQHRIDLYSSQLNFSKAKIHSIFIDRNKGLWLGLFQKGVMYIPRSLSMIKSYGYRPNSTSDISSAAITAILAGDDNDLWIGTDGNGLYYVNKRGVAEQFEGDIPPTIMAIEHANSDKLWLCAYSDGLLLLDKNTGKVTSYNEKMSDVLKTYNKRTTCLEYDNNGNLWVGTYGSGVFRIGGRIESHISTSEDYNYNRNEPANNYINSIHAIGDNVWMGTYKGVSCYNTKIGAFVVVDKLLHDNIGSHVIYDICDDGNGTIWFATDLGLVRYNPMEKELEIIDNKAGLASEVAVAVTCDNLGRTWVGTYNGISCYDSKNRIIDNYYSHHGLQGNQFSRAAITTCTNGDIYFGGISGVTGFDPYTITPETSNLDLNVTGFLINGQEINSTNTSDNKPITTKSIIETDTFNISYTDRAFVLELSTFNFIGIERMRYEYRVPEESDEWSTNKQGDNIINIKTLSHGTYTIEMRAALDNLVSNVKTITVIVRPMWWQTWWAKTIFIVVALLLITLLTLSARERIKVKKELLEQEKAHSIDEAKFQFFFNLSHEIRTPLTLIINPIKELLNQEENENTKKYALIYRNSLRILRLINQLLDIRKIEKGQMVMQFTTVKIADFVKEVSNSFDYISEKRNIKTTFVCQMPDDITADIDPNQFDKILYNIYSNAYKFTPNKGEIKTTVGKDGNNIVITIEDNGCGIDPAIIHKIFDRFYQDTNEHSAQYAGTGIGLNYARNIVTLHNGTITATNQSTGTGAIFTVTIPQRQKNAKQQDNSEEIIPQTEETYLTTNVLEKERHRPSTNKVVLIVDDEPEISMFLQNELSRTYKVVCRSNGKDAYDYANKNDISMVISDIMMPEMDGITLCKKIKSNINLTHIPVILLTAKHSDEDRNKGLHTGADAYIAKPFDITHLRGTIHSLLSNRDRIMNKIHTQMSADPNNPKEGAPQRKVVMLKSQNEVLMQKVTQYIEQHISEPELNVASLAAYVGMSRVHMHRKLKELTGQSARDYIKSMRLQQAGILLKEKKLNISDVAYALGYNNLSHFSASFRDFFGMSPKDYMLAAKRNENNKAKEDESETKDI